MPRAGDLEDRGGVPLGALTREVLPEIPVLLGRIDPDQRRRLLRAGTWFTRRDRGEPGGGDRGLEIARTGDGDRVPGALRSAGDRNERQEVTNAADEREEHPHRSQSMDRLAGDRLRSRTRAPLLG
jgi:hypothetical protein